MIAAIGLEQLGNAQTGSLSLSSANATSNSSVSLNLLLASGSGVSPAALQWTLGYPSSAVVGLTVAPGPAATAAGKMITCSGNSCILDGAASGTVNDTAIADGVVATLTFQLSSSASGNLAIQFSTAYAAAPLGTTVPVSTTNGVISVAPVAVSLTPANSTLNASQTQQFTATVTGAGNTNVTWTLNPNVGSIGANGLYTAPAYVSAQQTVTVTATSVADPLQSATANITLLQTTTPSGIALVQHYTNDCGIVSSCSVSFASNTLQGDLIVLGLRIGNSQGYPTVSDSNGNHYRPALMRSDSSYSHQIYIYFAPNIAGGANAVTVSVQGAIRMEVAEFQGIATSYPLDQTLSAVGTGTFASTGSVTTSQPNELIFGIGSSAQTQSWTAGAGFSLLDTAGQKMADEFQIANSIATTGASYYLSTPDSWVAGVATFKAATGN